VVSRLAAVNGPVIGNHHEYRSLAQAVTINLNLRTYYPVLIDAGFADLNQPIPWWNSTQLPDRESRLAVHDPVVGQDDGWTGARDLAVEAIDGLVLHVAS
jgi:hypothetical protein